MIAPRPGPELTERERQVMQSYLSDTEAPLRRQKSISVRYALGAGLWMLAAFWFDSLWLAVPVYLLFVFWLGLRYRALRRHSADLTRIFTVFEKKCGRSGPDPETAARK